MNIVQAYDERWVDMLRTLYQQHGVFIAPTESVYGLSCSALDPLAVERVYRMKRRDYHKPMIVLARDLEMVAEYCEVSDDVRGWVSEYWPGPLTLILPARREMVASDVLAGGSTMAIRVSSHRVISQCIEINGAPIISTSANFSGEEPLTREGDIRAQFGHTTLAPDLFISAGDLPSALPSTVVDCTRTPWRIMRNGSLIPVFPHVA